jgi:hypothetical protein
MILTRPGLWVGGAIGFIFILVALAEFSMGRLFICKCNEIVAWYPYTNGSGNSQHLADWYSVTHVFHGFLFYILLWVVARKLPARTRLILAVVLEGIWEVFENTSFTIERYRAATIALDYYGDSIVNSLSDIVFMIMGFVLAWRLPAKLSLVLVLVIELGLGILVHDNLTLNIVMLPFPIESVKEWQASPTPIQSSP